MSRREAPSSSPSGSWLASLDLAAAEKLVGKNALDAALATLRVYVEAPALERESPNGSRVVAVVMETPDGTRLSSPIKVALRIQGGDPMGASPPNPDRVEASCAVCKLSLGRQQLCEHTRWLLIDLAVCEDLRLRLAAAETIDDVELNGVLPGLRQRALEARTLEERLEAWLPPAQVNDDFEIDVEAVTTPSTTTAEGPRSALLLYHRKGRSLLAARDVLASRLTPKHRRMVDVMVPYHGNRHALVATRGQASIVIHLLRDEIGARVRFPEGRVKPRVDREESRLVVRWVVSPSPPNQANQAETVVATAEESFVFAGPFPYLWVPKTRAFYVIDPSVDLEAAMGMQRVPSLALPPSAEGDAAAARVGKALLLRGRGRGITLPKPEVFGLPPMIAPSFELRLHGSPLDVRAELFAIYDGVGKLPAGEGQTAAADARDLEAEAKAIAMLEHAGFTRDPRGDFVAAEERAVELWRVGLDELRASTAPRFEVFVAESIAKARIGPPLAMDLRVGTTAGWLDTELEFRAGALKVEIERLHKVLASGKRWLELSDGSLSKIADEVATLIGQARLESKQRLPPHQFGRVARWIELADSVVPGSPIHVDVDANVKALVLRLRDRTERASASLTLPADVGRRLEATLRPYQRVGVAWLELLRELGAGGLLADDMGLGKTLMTLTFLAAIRGEPRPSLVVCPTSVVGNWIREAERFVPDLRVAAYTGNARRRTKIEDHDLLVTTYGVLRRDLEKALGRVRFRCVVLDEAQNIKNPASVVARCARKLEAETRIALTGTPVENRLSELWSLMTFVNPGMLGTAAEFDARYERPIANRPDGAVAAELRDIVRPFILRRTKRDVLGDLPAKTEINRSCVFGLRQKRLYDALALTMREAMAKNLEKRGAARTQLTSLTAILRLRQMACDPRLVDPSASPQDSAKRAAFLELVRELVAEERRALVFSQFVELLTLWRADLDEAKVPYEYLDGATSNRDEVVERFQKGSAPLFLVSLKAGGSGLNLTAADTVIHVDPWWNPAAEDQATDRAHRIGQTRPVTVIRLVAEGTIEDKLLLLKEHKRELAGAILDEGDMAGARLTSLLTDEDVALLLGDATVAEEEDDEEEVDAERVASDPRSKPTFPGSAADQDP